MPYRHVAGIVSILDVYSHTWLFDIGASIDHQVATASLVGSSTMEVECVTKIWDGLRGFMLPCEHPMFHLFVGSFGGPVVDGCLY